MQPTARRERCRKQLSAAPPARASWARLRGPSRCEFSPLGGSPREGECTRLCSQPRGPWQIFVLFFDASCESAQTDVNLHRQTASHIAIFGSSLRRSGSPPPLPTSKRPQIRDAQSPHAFFLSFSCACFSIISFLIIFRLSEALSFVPTGRAYR